MSTRRWLVLALLVPLYLWRLDRPAFSDTEGMFAEPARGMVASGDWVTPRINGEPFFTKPPLMYWLPAALWSVTGPTEYARLWSVLAAFGTVAITAALGGRLFGPEAGFVAAAVLGTSVGQFLESRMLRADMVLVLLVTTALWLWVRLRAGEGRGVAVAFWAVLALGVLDKGLPMLVIVGGVIVASEPLSGTVRSASVSARLRALYWPAGLLVFVAIAAPWHVVAAWRNPGFTWDYVVNQHVLFFFDRKMPRDSIPDSLGMFWAKFFVRGLPWSLLWPAALLHAWRVSHAEDEHREGYRLVTAWLAVVLGFFSLASSRLEHYAMPALPAAALFVGALIGDVGRGRSRVARGWLAAPLALASLVALGGLALDPQTWIAGLEPTLAAYPLASLGRAALLVTGAGFLTVAALFVRRRAMLALAAGTALSVAMVVFVQVAHERVEPLFSWRPIALRIRAERPDGTAPVFFRASDEYQLCGGLAYYLDGERLDLLMPPGWLPPTFLEGRVTRLFTSRDAFEASWRAGGAFLVSDDVWPPGAETSLAPGPHALVMRTGSKVLLRALGRSDATSG